MTMIHRYQRKNGVRSKLIVLGCVLLLVCISACNRDKRPTNFPKLVPCHITLTQEGAPVADVLLLLASKDEEIPWVISGKTGNDGKATIMTHGKFTGIPLGKFSIVLKKQEIEGYNELTHDDDDSVKKKPEGKIFSLVDLKYTKQDTTPLEISVEKKTEATFEIGPAVRILTGKLSDV